MNFRLRNRSTETPEKIAMRIEKAQLEMAYSPRFDKVLINDQLPDALASAEKLIREFLAH